MGYVKATHMCVDNQSLGPFATGYTLLCHLRLTFHFMDSATPASLKENIVQ